VHDHKNHFKQKTVHIFERMIRKFGYDEIYRFAGEGDEKKVLVGIKKKKDRAKKKKAGGGDGDGDEVVSFSIVLQQISSVSAALIHRSRRHRVETHSMISSTTPIPTLDPMAKMMLPSLLPMLPEGEVSPSRLRNSREQAKMPTEHQSAKRRKNPVVEKRQIRLHTSETRVMNLWISCPVLSLETLLVSLLSSPNTTTRSELTGRF
jgi:hypothetical protein